MKTVKGVIASMLLVLLIAGSAHAVSIKGQDISTIPDILRHARGLTGKEVSLELRKDSLLWLHDDGQLDLRYNIGNGDKDSSLGKINDYAYREEFTIHEDTDFPYSDIWYFTEVNMRDNGISAILTETKFGGKKVLIAASRPLARKVSESFNRGMPHSNAEFTWSNWFYDLYFETVSKGDDGKISQSRFGAWRYPKEEEGKNSGYIKDVKTGIFVDGFEGELVVAATMTTTNDNINYPADYSTKSVGARLDFWALFTDDSGNVQYKKLDNLTQTKSGFTASALNGMKNAPDSEWSATNPINTAASPYMAIKTAAGDFNNDGYANEVAVLATDNNGIYMWMYQLEYKDGAFTIRTMKDKTTIFSYRYPGYFSTWSYNGWNRTPGADILAGDFDGDGKTDIAVIFQGDFPSGERNAMLFGGTVKTLHTNLYKWDNNTGDLKATPYEVNDYENRLERPFTQKRIGYSGMYHNHYYYDVRGYTRELNMSWGGFKATVLDIDGDGKDEIALAGYRSRMYYHVKDTDQKDVKGGADRHAEYRVRPYLSLVRMDSDGRLKSSRIYEGDPIIDKRYTSYNGWDENNTDNWNAFQLQECGLAPVDTDAELYPIADREIAIAAGAFYGQTGLAKERDDLALRLKGGKLILFKSSGSTLNSAQTLTADGTSALVAGDFASEGIELGRPVFITHPSDKTYMAVIQAPPFHVDTVSADGKTVTANPVNFSYVSGAKVSYGKKSSNLQVQTTKFDMHSSIETIFAMDSDMTRNVIGGAKTAANVYGAVKNIVSIIPGTSNFESLVKKVKSVDGAASSVFKFLDNITDKVETINEGYNSEIKESEIFSEITARDQDTLGYVEAIQYIWRYPIVTKPAPLRTLSDDAKYLTKQDFVTFTIYGKTAPTTGVSASDYQPRHENGNLFSYPAAVANIDGYSHIQKELTRKENIQFGASNAGTATFTQVKANETTESKKVQTGYITTALSLVDSIFGTNLAKIPEGGTGPTYTRKESSSEQISWELPRAASSLLDRSYTTEYQAFVAEDGAVTCGFAVKEFSNYNNLFNSASLYRTLPDPAFPLPYKFKNSDSSAQLPKFIANPSRGEAMEIRGARFYAIDFNRYTSSRLLKGARYRVEIPIYNASFTAANNVKVSLYWVKDRTAESLKSLSQEQLQKQLIGTQNLGNIPGWSNLGNNKTWAKFEFTPNMTENTKDQQHYQLYALIDPDGKLTEVHENRDLAKDSGGNNEGYIEFSVETVESAKATASFYAGEVRASLSYEDIVFPEMTYSGYTSWKDFYNAKIAGTQGPVELEVTITNKMDLTIPRVEILAIYFDDDLWNTQHEIGRAHFARNITLFPYETYSYTFTIADDVANELRKVGLTNTACSYTPRSLFEILSINESEVTLSGDADPQFEIFSGDISVDVEVEEETDTTSYYDSVITQTYEMSNDVAVYWRVESIADVITDTSADLYVKDSAASPATPEEFSLVWDPSDAETNMTSTAALTISTIPGVTRAGQYAFRIQISEDGETWKDKEALTFGNVSGSSSSGGNFGTSSSSGGCDSGLNVLGLGLIAAALIMRKKNF